MKLPKILIVDDDVKLTDLTQAVLQRVGSFDTLAENRSFAALATARTYRPDVILLDVDMPGKDGGDVATELGMDPDLRCVPIIFLSSLISEDDAGTREGVRYLSKPAKPNVLIEAVREALGVAA
jgi:CheY-like chemotaxis protein